MTPESGTPARDHNPPLEDGSASTSDVKYDEIISTITTSRETWLYKNKPFPFLKPLNLARVINITYFKFLIIIKIETLYVIKL